MPTISLRVPDEEFAIFKSFARHSNTSVSEMIRQAVLERIETEYDLSILPNTRNKRNLANSIHVRSASCGMSLAYELCGSDN
ncbi:type II toxin-antitoxin system RelB family antitoxin [Trueperella pyogenes]|uniref:type II toxin-antitoxin system RelB family antitoxin n=1 Tax=Trueperella pyogenes TaxID=1661 RepID=UPI00345C8E9D